MWLLVWVWLEGAAFPKYELSNSGLTFETQEQCQAVVNEWRERPPLSAKSSPACLRVDGDKRND